MSDRDLDTMLDELPVSSESPEPGDEALAAWRTWVVVDQMWHEEGERWRRAEPALMAAAGDRGVAGLLDYQQSAARYDRAGRTAWSTLTRVLNARPRSAAGAAAILRALRSLGVDTLEHPDIGVALGSVIQFLETDRTG